MPPRKDAATPRKPKNDYLTGAIVTPKVDAKKGKARQSPTAQGTASKCLEEIARYEKQYDKWLKRGKGIVERYRDDRDQASQTDRGFNILWSNVQILKPTLYARAPKAEIVRRFKDQDNVARIACEVAERATDVETEFTGLDHILSQCVDDRLLVGRGQAWVSFNPEIEGEEPVDGYPDDRMKTKDQLLVDYVDYRDFGHSPVPTWQKVTKVWRWKYFDKTQFKNRFGDKWIDSVEFSEKKDKAVNEPENTPQARIAEVWDRVTRKVYWVSKAVPDYLDEYDDPLRLEGFYPCPMPLYATTTNNTLEPVPDFYLYQDQANEVDKLTGRINRLTDALKIVGVYDDSVKELSTLLAPRGVPDNTLVPVNMDDLTGKGNLRQAVQIVDISTVITTIQACYVARQQAIEVIYQITGISDVIRGATDPNETAEAQNIKAQFGGTRIRKMQQDVAKFSRDLLRIMCELIVEMYDPETLWQMTNAESFVGTVQPPPPPQIPGMPPQSPLPPQPDVQIFADALKLLKNDKLRSFRVDIETDSTIALDESEAKQEAVQFSEAMGSLFQQAVPAVAQAPYLGEMVGEMIMFVARRFKAGRTMEGTIEKAIAAGLESAKQPKPPSPEEQKAQAEMAALQAKAQMEAQKQQADMAAKQQDMALKAQEHQSDLQFEREKQAQTLQFEREKFAMEMEQTVQKSAVEAQNAERMAAIKEVIAVKQARPKRGANVRTN